MARGVASPAPTPLPKVSFVKVPDEPPAGLHDLQARSYGYNDFSEFRRPEHYIRYIEPLESELAVQVEYDMDEQDQEWLDTVNGERKKDQLDRVSCETFEIVMDRLEKEWFDLTKNIPKPDMALPSEDSTCAICDDSEGENTNAIVFCDGCNLAVHQDCYGVPYIPEGQWLCRKCTVSPENPVSCILCPNEGGAFKQTVHGEWVHLLCAIWVPETRVANEVFMEPITGVEKISKQRWKLKCTVCDVREGACIQCSRSSCFLAFHVTCARKEKYLLPMKATSGLEPPPLQCFCERHMPRESAIARLEAIAAEAALTPTLPSDPKSNKSARAYAKTYKPGPPVVPSLIVNRILSYVSKISVRRRQEFVEMVCRYWSLKREARRGAPLLKRLHLEPWTASASGRVQTDEERAVKLEFMKSLKQDLEKLRTLAELSRKRESRKLKQMEVVHQLVSHILFAHESALRMAFERIVMMDRSDYFKNSVSKTAVPDYPDIVKHPMWWGAIDAKLDRHEYWDVRSFTNDVSLVLDNAILYNKPGTAYSKAAQRIKVSSLPILAELDKLATSAPSEPVRPPVQAFTVISTTQSGPTESPTAIPAETPTAETPQTALEWPIGDLESPLAILNLLTSPQSIADDFNYILTSAPLPYLFSYEFSEDKPPPPPRPPKSKRDRKAEASRRRHVAAVSQHVLDTSPGFRAPPRTRSAAKYEAEVTEGVEDIVTVGGSEPATALPSRKAVEEKAETSVQGDGAVATLGKRKRQKRAVVVLRGQGSEPAVLADVNPKASFKHFDTGWILDAGTKRGGRTPVERGPPPPPRKRMKHVPSASFAAPSVSIAGPSVEPASNAAPVDTPAVETPSLPPVNPEPAPGSPPVMAAEAAPNSPPVMVTEPIPIEPTQEVDEPMPDVDLEFDEVGEATAPTVDAVTTSTADEVPIYTADEIPIPTVDEVLVSTVDLTTEDNHPSVEVRPETPINPTISEPDLISPPPELSEQSVAPHAASPTPDIPAIPIEIELEPNEVIVKDPDGKLVIEELDTPATRREKALRRKTTLAASVSKGKAGSKPKAGPSRLSGIDGDSDLSSLSDMESDTEQKSDKGSTRRMQGKRGRKRGAKVKPKWTKAVPDGGRIILKDGETLTGGTLVWAKMRSYPWWGAVVYDPDHPDVRRNRAVQNTRPVQTDEGPYLVRFYETSSAWQWLYLKDLRLLGEDDAFDQAMLAQPSKTDKLLSGCRGSYEQAIAERESDGDGHKDEEQEDAPPEALSDADPTDS